MEVFKTSKPLQTALKAIRKSGKTIGLVPTMGNLHDGHLALVAAAKNACDFVLFTIFVNPLQFGPAEDLDNYPRTLAEDCDKLTAVDCDGVFIPADSEMYPGGLGLQTLVTVPGLSDRHCGASRPGHFNGVCTVVCKLFNLTQPDVAFFGEKDFQQLQIIRKMSADLCILVRIAGVPTVRNSDGLALSSRNSYLNSEQLARAPALYRQLQDTAQAIQQGKGNFDQLQKTAVAGLETAGLKADYFNICNATTLAPARNLDTELVILAAAWLGGTRLIDNITVSR
jgi:pantoate--beta-alanine ligase